MLPPRPAGGLTISITQGLEIRDGTGRTLNRDV